MSAQPQAQPRQRTGDPARRFEDVRRIAVLRGGGLGDLMFALPAVESLASAYPEAEITLLGMPLHRALLQDRPSPFTSVELLPVRPGVRDGVEDPAATADFVRRMRERQFDLGVQVHGGGRNSNPFLLELGARRLRLTEDEREVRDERSRPGAPVTVVLHPGATDPPRRWPTESYAALATALATDGADIVVVGDASE